MISSANPAQWATIAVQGAAGAYAHMVAQAVAPQAEVRFCPTFEDAFAAVEEGNADGAAIPIENSTMGRIADIHRLLPHTRLHIVAEHFLPVSHCLLGVKGATLADVRQAYSQIPALAQCRHTLKSLGLEAVPWTDTADAARMVAEAQNPAKAAVASRLAGEVYGLTVLQEPLNDEPHNTTRFVLWGRTPVLPPLDALARTSLMFRVRDIPAALYKALGGFATNGINLTKLESYILDGDFHVAQFYAECDGHTESPAMNQALEELAFYSSFVRVLGCYPKAEKAA